MEYIVCWHDGVRNLNVWMPAESRREVAALLIRHRLENNEAVTIFRLESESEASIIPVEDIFAGL